MMMATVLALAAPAAASPTLHGPTKMGTGDTGTFFLEVDGVATYRATIVGGSVEPDFGIVDGDAEIEVTMPSTPGRHWLKVTFTFDDGSEREKQWFIDVYEPYVFTATIVNNGDIAVVGLPVKFILNGVTVIHETTVNLAAGETKTVEYRYVTTSLSNGRHTITVVLDANDQLVTLSDGATSMTTAFYIGQADYSLANTIMGITVAIMALGLVWVYRKPRRNYGRPRGRR